MKRSLIMALIALHIACAPDALEVYANTADSVVREANRYESELAQICKVAGLKAAEAGDDAKVEAIEQKCHQVWIYFGDVSLAQAKFSRSIDESKLDVTKMPSVLSALNELTEAEKRLVDAVESLRKDLV